MKRKAVIIILAILLSLGSACSKPGQVKTSEMDPALLGKKTGVISLRKHPELNNRKATHEKILNGTASGAQQGAMIGLVFAGDILSHGTVVSSGSAKADLIALAIIVAALPASVLAGGIIGGTAGAIGAVFARDLELENRLLDISLDSLDVQTALRGRLISAAQTKANREITDLNKIAALSGEGKNLPKNEKELIKSGIFNQSGLDSVIVFEASVIKLTPLKDERDPLLSLSIDADARVFSSSGNLIYTAKFRCKRETHRFKDWTENNCSLFYKALENCYDDIANQAAERIFRP